MDFLNELEKTATDAFQKVSNKTKELSEILRLKNMIHTCDEVMELKYREIGKAYYEIHGMDLDNEFAEECKAIKDAANGKKTLQEELDALKNTGE